MDTTMSADGTPIAYETTGEGPAIVVVNGAFSTAKDSGELAAALAGAGFRAVGYDRRARGASGDTRPYAPVLETEDLAAVIEAVGGVVATIGHSSGAVLALYAASLGVPTGRLFLSEPPFRFEDEGPSPDLPERLQALVDAGRDADAVIAFQLDGIGLPRETVDRLRASPAFDALVPLAQSAVYDATLTRDVADPTAAMRSVATPTTVLSGVQTFPFLRTASERLASVVPGAEFVEVPESIGHRLDAVAATRIVAARLGRD